MKDIEIFEKVKTHLLSQKLRSTNAAGVCMYRGDGGRMCAAGCLIKDEFYKPELENISASSAIIHFAITQSIGDYSTTADALVSALQGMHDGKKPEDWEAYLNTFKFSPTGEYILYSFTGRL